MFVPSESDPDVGSEASGSTRAGVNSGTSLNQSNDSYDRVSSESGIPRSPWPGMSQGFSVVLLCSITI